MQDNALGIVGVAARPRGGLGGGAGGRGRSSILMMLVLAEHRLEFVHSGCWLMEWCFGVLEKVRSDDVEERRR